MVIRGYLLDHVTAQALLYETFQSNLTGLKSKGSHVFMLILQYYLVDLGREVLSEKVFKGNDLHDKIQSLLVHESGEKSDACIEEFTVDFQSFLVNHFKIQDLVGYDEFIKGLFGRSVDRFNARFFASFLKTSHEQVVSNMEKLNASAKAKHEITFTSLVEFIGDFLQYCVMQVFFQPNLAAASRQFKDSESRFSENNIAMTMVELLLYRELPFQENQWMATLAEKFKNQVDMALVGEARDGLKQISPEILGNFIIHDRSLKQTTPLLHERIYNDIIKPFHVFNHLARGTALATVHSWPALESAVVALFGKNLPEITTDATVRKQVARVFAAVIDWVQST
jgi:hypothetical protein